MSLLSMGLVLRRMLSKDGGLTGEHVPADGVRVQVERVDLEVNPVECEGLNQTQDCLAEERIHTHAGTALVQDTQHAGPKHQRNKSVCSFDPVLDVRAGEELQALSPRGRYLFLERVGSLEKNHDKPAKEIECYGCPNQSLPARLLHVDAADPERCRDERDDAVPDHGGAHHGNEIRIPEQTDNKKQPCSDVERNEGRIRVLKSIHHIRRKPEQTRQNKQHTAPPQHIIAIKPRNQQTDIAPKLPPHNKRNRKPQQRRPIRVLRRRIARHSNNPHVKQINKQLVARHLLRLARPPQQPLVEILPHNRLLEHAHRRAQLAPGLPRRPVEPGLARHAVRVAAAVFGPQVRAVPVLGEVGVELHRVLAQHVQLRCERVEGAQHVLEFGVERGVRLF